MSRNSKNARNLARAKKITEMHLKGEKGPAKTNPQHGKKSAWWQKFPDFKSYIRGGKKPQRGSDQSAEASN